MDSKPTPIPFGIPQLDDLFGFENLDSAIGCLSTPTTMTIVGEDGTGKSVFGLHLAANYAALHYRADSVGPKPLIVYASSDLRYVGAAKMWSNFYLDYPWARYVPFISDEERKFRREKSTGAFCHVPLCPTPMDKLAEGVLAPRSGYKVLFLDMAEARSGDDWMLLSRLLAALPRGPEAPPHLLIVDSVAGFMTLTGDLNSFGDESDRRARISQLLRAAEKSWHVVLISEEPDLVKHHPEEYVTDTVVHLRRSAKSDNPSRYLEIEKSRARRFGTGQHPFEIRDGRGTSTRSWENPDDPHTLVRRFSEIQDREAQRPKPECHAETPTDRQPYNGYIQVFPSLSYLSTEFSARRGRSSDKTKANPLAFGLKYLDNMLHPDSAGAQIAAPQDGGLSAGSVSALIGEEGTRKVSLAEEFLIEAYRDFPTVLGIFLEAVKAFRDPSTPKMSGQETFAGFVQNRRNWSMTYKWLNDDHEHSDSRLYIRDRVRHYPSGVADLDDRYFTGICRIKNEYRGKYKNSEGKTDNESDPLKTRWPLEQFVELLENVDPEDSFGPDFTAALCAIRLSAGILPSTVYFATHDVCGFTLAERIIDRFWSEIVEVLPSQRDIAQVKIVLAHVVAFGITARRCELVDASAPQLWHAIQSVAVHAVGRLGYTTKDLATSVSPMPFAEQVRVVISDLRLIREIYPAVARDPLFLPTVVFRLRRLGVTTLIVESESGRLDATDFHPMSGALRSLVDTQINTWKVNFFGNQRVAITVLPSSATSSSSPARELRIESDLGGNDPRIEIDPHFELFENIEDGKPRAVPLEIALYDETPAFRDYAEAERAAMQLIFAPELRSGGEPVLKVIESSQYSALRDYAQFPVERQLPFTLVFMVDGFWATGKTNSLRDQRSYLFDQINVPAQDNMASRFEDKLRMFVSTVGSGGIGRTGTTPAPEPANDRTTRSHFFNQNGLDEDGRKVGYQYTTPPRPPKVDRVPFMWDFGFLLCNEREWLQAARVPVRFYTTGGEHNRTVDDIYKRMARLETRDRTAEDKHGERLQFAPQGNKSEGPVSWREFLGACQMVAATETKRTQRPCRAFDLATASPDSLTCMAMEIWLSEIKQDVDQFRKLSMNKHQLRSLTNNPLWEELDAWCATAEKDLRCLSNPPYSTAGSVSLARMLAPWEATAESLRTALTHLSRVDPVPTKGTATGASQVDAKSTQEPRELEASFARFRLVREFGTPLGSYALHLYQMWLLLVEVLDFDEFVDPSAPFEFRRDRQPDAHAAATRHWYKTACSSALSGAMIDKRERAVQTLVPVRLPGYFSTRGDWFLAVAQGSRSHRLADLAVDVLSSRRANRTRLHLGLGLPVRDIVEGKALCQLRTGLSISTAESIYNVTYGHLLKLGGENGTGSPADFFWLFRSGFEHYDRQAVSARRWLQRMFEWTLRFRFEQSQSWSGGFKAYDELSQGDISTVCGYDSLAKFRDALGSLTADLNAAILADDQS